MQFILDVDHGLYITWIKHQQLREYKVEEKLHLEVCEQKMFEYHCSRAMLLNRRAAAQ
jgi:hypothetical protein